MPIKAGWWDSSLTLWNFSRSNKQCIQLSTTNTIYISRFVIAISAIRSSRLELFCKKGVLKNFARFTGVSSGTGASSEFCEILKKKLFSQNTYGGCFWHLHQSRSPILILNVMNQQLRREYVWFLSMVEQKTSFSHVYSSE